jgi:hypothetical protein
MNTEKPERVEIVDLKGVINEHALKVNQRLEMLREGHVIQYNTERWELVGEEVYSSKKIQLRIPDTEIILEMPVEMLSSDELELVA